MKERTYIIELNKRKMTLEAGIRKAEQFLENAPEGAIRTTVKGKKPCYYRVGKETGRLGKYMRKSDSEIVRALIQKEYAQKYLAEARAELKIIDKCIAKCREYGPEKSYNNLHKNKRILARPYQLEDEELVKAWLSRNHNVSHFDENEKIYPTKKGDLVRSKSEAMIADMYYELGIPYIYEKELVLKNGECKYPDFTVLDVASGKEIYHEHLGMLDKDNYRYKNLRKIEEYRRNGVFVGKNLIITHEAEGSPFNINNIRNWAKELFLK